jgi:hypothetical protein
MPPLSDVKLGPLTRTIIDNAVWAGSSFFPGNQAWADEFEKFSHFLNLKVSLNVSIADCVQKKEMVH